MTDTFKFAQGNDGITQYAHITVPGCGRNEKDDAPTILVEVEKDGSIMLSVYADIQSKQPTHEISLNGAKLEKKGQGNHSSSTINQAVPISESVK